jgi:formate hydrogenlyase subunit 7
MPLMPSLRDTFWRMRYLRWWRTPRARYLKWLKAPRVRTEPLTLPPGWRPKSLFIRHVDVGSSADTEREFVATTNPRYDIEHFGIRIVPSPRHADVLMLTGPFVRSMMVPLVTALRATPETHIITAGDSFGPENPFEQSYAVCNLPPEVEAARVENGHIAGDPPSPIQLIYGLLRIKL